MSIQYKALEADLFTEELSAKIRGGLPLVPFVGSGLSAPSGVMTGLEFTDYLTWVIYRSVGPQESTRGEPRLNLRAQGWPAMPKRSNIKLARDWVLDAFKAYCKKKKTVVQEGKPAPAGSTVRALEPLSCKDETHLVAFRMTTMRIPEILRDVDGWEWDEELIGFRRAMRQPTDAASEPRDAVVSATSHEYIQEMALRSLADWRDTLNFLSRLKLVVGPYRKNGDAVLSLANVDPYVIDSFNVFVTKERMPNYGHAMLAQLVSRSRIRMILTTNFDNLLEIALDDCGERFKAISVGLTGKLPDPTLVHSANTIIKLHGEVHETRADHSLDDIPSDDELERFASYLNGHTSGAGPSFLPASLFVCGVSGRDMRCLQMIKHALNVNPDARVYWVCHSLGDVEHVAKIFDRDGYSTSVHKSDETPRSQVEVLRSRVIVTRAERTDLLLAELYEKITLSLPRRGTIHQFSQNAPPANYGEQLQRKHEDRQLADDIDLGLDGTRNKLIVVSGASGILSEMRVSFREQTGRRRMNAIWLDLAEYHSPESAIHDALVQIATRLGRYQRDHARLFIQKDKFDQKEAVLFFKDLIKHWGLDTSKWIIYIYARNGYGGCNGWVEVGWKSKQILRLHKILKAIGEAKSDGAHPIRLVYAPFTKARLEHDKTCISSLAKAIRLRHPGWKERDHWQKRQKENLSAHANLKDLLDYEGVFIPALKGARGNNRDSSLGKDAKRELSSDDQTYQGALEWLKHEYGTSSEWSKSSESLDEAQALYAATLFRRARHICAFLSERVIVSRERMNLEAFDNDWSRWQLVNKWMRGRWTKSAPSEKSIRAFLRKPGNFAWMYRDIRRAIREYFELRVKWLRKSDGLETEFVGFAHRFSGRIHLSIGDWYQRACRATGHVEPLHEALYHYGRALVKATTAEPKRELPRDCILEYRQRLANRAFWSIAKTLRVTRAVERPWIQGDAGDDWYDLENDGVKKFLQQILDIDEDETGLESGTLKHWTNILRREFSLHPNSGEASHHTITDGANSLREFPTGPISGTASGIIESSTLDHSRVTRIDKQSAANVWWADAKRWGRSFLFGELCLEFERLCEKLAEFEVGKIDYSSEVVRDWRDGFRRTLLKTPDPNEGFVITCRLFFRLADALRARARLEAKRNKKWAPRTWACVSMLCWCVLDFCRDLDVSRTALEAEMRVSATTLQGLALGRLNRFFEAHQRLNDAESSLGWLEPGQGKFIAGVVELRRAEVHFLEAQRLREQIDHWPDSGTRSPGRKTGGRTDRHDEANPRASGAVGDESKEQDRPRAEEVQKLKSKAASQLREIYLLDSKKDPNECRRMLAIAKIAKLDDTTLALERARLALGGRSRSSRWWWQLYYLTLCCMGEFRSFGSLDPVQGDFKGLAFRVTEDYGSRIEELFSASCVAAQSDWHLEEACTAAVHALSAARRLNLTSEGGCMSAISTIKEHSKGTSWENSVCELIEKEVYP